MKRLMKATIMVAIAITVGVGTVYAASGYFYPLVQITDDGGDSLLEIRNNEDGYYSGIEFFRLRDLSGTPGLRSGAAIRLQSIGNTTAAKLEIVSNTALDGIDDTSVNSMISVGTAGRGEIALTTGMAHNQEGELYPPQASLAVRTNSGVGNPEVEIDAPLTVVTGDILTGGVIELDAEATSNAVISSNSDGDVIITLGN